MCLTIPACDSADDGGADYRYKLTVEVDTLAGLRIASSVIEVEQSVGRTAMGGFGKIVLRHSRGEAVGVDLPNGRKLFALLHAEDDVDWSNNVMQNSAPKFAGETFESQLDNMLLMKSEKVLPRNWKAYPDGHDPHVKGKRRYGKARMLPTSPVGEIASAVGFNGDNAPQHLSIPVEHHWSRDRGD